VPPADRLRFAAVAAYLKLLGDPARLTPDTAAAWSRRWFGRAAHEAILEPLLRGKFGARHDEIAMSWLWSRIHERTPSLGYLAAASATCTRASPRRSRAPAARSGSAPR
jgi:protoporphyrinogen oxidase